MTENDCRQATPHADLISELMDSRRAKSEREHAAAREIESLRARVAELEEHIAHVETWVKEGEEAMRGGKSSYLFCLGAWWAFRPWNPRLRRPGFRKPE